MLRLTLVCSLALLLTGIGSWASVANAADSTTAAPTSLNKDDAEFVRMALLSGMAETKASELAIKRGLAGADLEFAKMMTEAHSEMDGELKSLARAKGVAIPTALDETLQKKQDELGRKTDVELPEAYRESQVAAHKSAVSAYKTASDDAKDVDVKAFAAKYLSHLQVHLEKAKALGKKS